ncbi:MAG: hypothetical protein M3Z92_06580 [Bacteroidota bacterium]|nr:hypothetical protein [Bacteroidota bacterium]
MKFQHAATPNESFTRRIIYQKLILLVVWMGIQVFLLWHEGVVTALEATKYIEQAHVFLETGKYSSGNFLFYSVQILLIALFLKLKISFLLLVFIQIIINGVSVACFYNMVNKLSSNIFLSFLSTLYFLVFYYYHVYNTYLFTESLFFSFSVIYAYFLFTRESITIKNIVLIVLFLCILYLTRPTGIFFIPATFLYLITKFYSRHAFKIITISVLFALVFFYFLFNYSLGSGGEFDFLLPYLDERIICGVPTIIKSHDIIVPVEKNSIAGLLYIISHHFNLFFKLAIQRLIAFFGIYRPFYSVFHNIFACAYFYFIYIIIIAGVRDLFKKNKAEVWFLLTNIGLMAITVMLSCDEWSNRFILSVLPFFLLLSVLSICNYKNRLNV